MTSPHDADLPPHDLRAEQSVLGAILLAPAAMDDIAGMVAAGDFYQHGHAEVFDVASKLTTAGQPVDHVTVSAELERRGTLTRVGGAPYLHTLIQTVPSVVSAGYYADIVAEKAKLRKLVETGHRIAQRALGNVEQGEADGVIEDARQMLDKLAEDGRTTETLNLDDMVAEMLDDLENPAPPGLPTCLIDLDEMLGGGLYDDQLIVVGARPGVGKSVLGGNLSARTAARNLGVLFASLEMSRKDVLQRMFASLKDIELGRLRDHNLTPDDWRRVHQAAEMVSGWPLTIDDRPNQTITSIRTKARNIKRSGVDLRLIVVDYLQLLRSGSRRPESRQLEISEFTRGLKLLAKELHVPIVAISQVNRGSEQRADKRPTMADLRESGSIEADADTVILLHRDPESPTEIDAIVAKQRQGPTGTVKLRWRGHYSRIDNLGDRHLEAV